MKKIIKKAYYLLEGIIVWTAINTFRFATGFVKQVYANRWRSTRLAMRALLPVFAIWIFAMAGVDHRNKNLDYSQPLIKSYSYEEVEIERLTRELQDMESLKDIKLKLEAGDKDITERYVRGYLVSEGFDKGQVDKLMYTLAHKESGFSKYAQNWNCYYGEESTSCRPSDRHRAWSVDCGIGQINISAKNCPAYTYELDWQLEKISYKLRTQGLRAWVGSWGLL